MKGKIRKTGEEITIVSYYSRTYRDEVLDYVSYIDSNGVEHPNEKMNLYWDIEVIQPNEERAAVQIELLKRQIENSERAVEKQLSRRELLAGNILGGIASKVYDRSGNWKMEDLVWTSICMADALLDKLNKEEQS